MTGYLSKKESFLLALIKSIFRTKLAIYMFVGVFFLFYSSQSIHLPGLYMDAINPEYQISEILYSESPIFGKWLMPGNVLNDRYPVFSGPVYHGSLQVYATLPFLFLTGVELESFRFFQIIVALVIIAMIMYIVGRLGADIPKINALQLIVGLLIATDPVIAFGIRTQAYSIIFAFPLFLLSWILLEVSFNFPQAEFAKKRFIYVFISGALLGLAVFGYFVYVFFVPAFILLFINKSTQWTKVTKTEIIIWSKDFLAWIAGGFVGASPFLLGVTLLIKNLGGGKAALEWWHTISTGLHILREDQSVIGRLGSVLSQLFAVISGEWLFRQILKEFGALNESASVIKVLLILFVFFLWWWWSRTKKTSKFAVLAIFMYLVFALVFGTRLSGHHFIVILPLIYLGLVVNHPPEKIRNKLNYLWWCGYVFIICINIIVGIMFLQRLKATGGAGLYSDVINRFSNFILTEHRDSFVYFPDWGYRMPFTFLAKGAVDYDARVDPVKIGIDSCHGRESFVLFNGTGNDGRLELIEGISRVQAEKSTWYQLDGIPVFELGYFPAGSGCDFSSGNDLAGGQITVTPQVYYSCNFLSKVSQANVEWDFSSIGIDRVEVYVSSDGVNKTLWIAGDGAGSKFTGPWTHGGLSFIFISPVNGNFLGEFRVEQASCPLEKFEDNGWWQGANP